MTKFFKEEEFTCNGVNCFDKMVPSFINRLNAARGFAGVPFVINSSWRSENHNKSVGGKSNSSHLRGLAVDIRCNDNKRRMKIITGLIQAGFKRIGVSDRFIHVDDDESLPTPRMWLY
jgi:uncharacterized protein YcbK (DUF882 family)